MGRIYDRAGTTATIEMHERNRAAIVRGAAHVEREATVDRTAGVRMENPQKWINPTSLDAPPPRPGCVQRWVSQAPRNANGHVDDRHWLKKMREGWSPRDPATISLEMRQLFPSVKISNGHDVIAVAGLVLCEMPAQVARQRKLAVGDLIKHQQDSVPESLQELRDKQRERVIARVEENDERTFRGRKPATMVD